MGCVNSSRQKQVEEAVRRSNAKKRVEADRRRREAVNAKFLELGRIGCGVEVLETIHNGRDRELTKGLSGYVREISPAGFFEQWPIPHGVCIFFVTSTTPIPASEVPRSMHGVQILEGFEDTGFEEWVLGDQLLKLQAKPEANELILPKLAQARKAGRPTPEQEEKAWLGFLGVLIDSAVAMPNTTVNHNKVQCHGHSQPYRSHGDDHMNMWMLQMQDIGGHSQNHAQVHHCHDHAHVHHCQDHGQP